MAKGPFVSDNKLDRSTGPRVDLTNQIFGRLTVKNLYGKNKRSHYKWICECECGTETIVFGTHLRSGKTKSCGCYNAELAEERGRKYSKEDSVYRNLFKVYKRGAKVRNLNFDLSFQDFKELGSGTCYYCGAEPVVKDTDDIKNTIPSLFNGIDRVDSSVGYILNNCVSCCSICNSMKNSLTVEEFENHIFRICLNNSKKFEKYKGGVDEE